MLSLPTTNDSVIQSGLSQPTMKAIHTSITIEGFLQSHKSPSTKVPVNKHVKPLALPSKSQSLQVLESSKRKMQQMYHALANEAL